MSDVTLYCGDCLEIIPTLPAQSVDAILTDIPYGTTACSWDEVLPFEPMWAAIKHVLKPRGVFVTTASQPFTSRLVCSNLDWFKYEWIIDKDIPGNPLLSRYQPLKVHENICIFSRNGHIYKPQSIKGKRRITRTSKSKMWNLPGGVDVIRDEYLPRSIIEFSFADKTNIEHTTQKPIALYTYLTLTYTNEGDTVLDMCAGSGTTGVACVQTGRNFIGIEKRQDYFEIMQRRIKQAQMQLRLGI